MPLRFVHLFGEDFKSYFLLKNKNLKKKKYDFLSILLVERKKLKKKFLSFKRKPLDTKLECYTPHKKSKI
jgi:hypothetical protein